MSEHARRPRPPATDQDVLDAPPNMVAELIEGALRLHPRPAFPHGVAATSLADEIVSPFQKRRGKPGGWFIVVEPELHLGADVLVPGLAGWRQARMPVFPEAPWLDLAPDSVCEALSPGTRRLDLTDKRRLHAENGVAHLWLIDRKDRTLEAFALEGARWVLVAALGDDEEMRVPPFDAVAVPLSVLWPE